MRVFFIGTVEFSKRTLEKLIHLNADVVGVATKSKSDFNADFANLVPLCEEQNIPYKCVKNVNAPHIISWIKDLNPDVIFCFGWSNLLRKEILDLTSLGVIGYHPAELPMNRGRHPVIWALALGLKQTASTFFFMEEGADDGDILSQAEVLISNKDNASTLYEKLIKAAIAQITVFLKELETDTFTRVVQEHSKANVWRKRGMGDGKIDFRMSGKAIYNLVRALAKPYIGAHIERGEEDIIIWKSEIGHNDRANLEPGKVLRVKDRNIEVKTGDGSIWLTDHEFLELPKVNHYL